MKMNETQAKLLDPFIVGFFPYSFDDAIKNHNHKPELFENLKGDIGKYGKFWNFIDNIREIKFDSKTDELIIEQQVNEMIGTLVFISYAIESINYITKKGNKGDSKSSISVFKQHTVVILPFDYSDPIKQLSIVFKNNLEDDLKIIINTIEYKEPVQSYEEKIKEYEEQLKLTVNTGHNLINVFIEPVLKEYSKTLILNYIDRKHDNDPNSQIRKIKEIKLNQDEIFKAFVDIGFGKYEIILKLIDNNNEVYLIKKDILLSRSNYGGKPMIGLG
jgi:hypothetical protein